MITQRSNGFLLPEEMMAPKASPPSVSKTIKGSVGGAGSSSSTPPESKKSRSTTTKLISKNVSSSEVTIAVNFFFFHFSELLFLVSIFLNLLIIFRFSRSNDRCLYFFL